MLGQLTLGPHDPSDIPEIFTASDLRKMQQHGLTDVAIVALKELVIAARDRLAEFVGPADVRAAIEKINGNLRDLRLAIRSCPVDLRRQVDLHLGIRPPRRGPKAFNVDSLHDADTVLLWLGQAIEKARQGKAAKGDKAKAIVPRWIAGQVVEILRRDGVNVAAGGAALTALEIVLEWSGAPSSPARNHLRAVLPGGRQSGKTGN